MKQEEVLADYEGVAHVILRLYGDQAWFILLERITNEEGGKAIYVPFWRGVLKTLDRVKEKS